MRVTINSDFTYEIEQMLSKMPKEIEKNEKTLLKKCGEIVQKNLKRYLTRSNRKNPKNYDKTTPYIHIIDDIKVTVKKSKYGHLFVKIAGGKKTGFKWRFLNDGAIDERGNILNVATHFMEHALEDSSNEINEEINKMMERVANIE